MAGTILTIVDVSAVLAARDITGLYRSLQAAGVSQRLIAERTGQSQSEISEILSGRRVVSVAVLERIVDGLGIARATIGLVQPEVSTEPVAVTGVRQDQLRRLPRRPPLPVGRGSAGRILDRAAPRVDVPLWTARDVWALRHTLRHSVREFSQYLGVSAKQVTRREDDVAPNPFQRGLLHTALSRLDVLMQSRFARLSTEDLGPTDHRF
jgi:transcriptional regulator with XRE-family HTH domain